MPRRSAAVTIEEVVRNAIAPVVRRAVKLVANAAADLAAEHLAAELRRSPRTRARFVRGSRRRRVGIRKWTADRRARRVPTFVIEATGLDTKKRIVAKYGENATFQKGKPLPRAK